MDTEISIQSAKTKGGYQLTGRAGNIIYTAPYVATFAEAISEFRLHVDHISGLSERVPVQRMLMREIREVQAHPTIRDAGRYAALNNEAHRLERQLDEISTVTKILTPGARYTPVQLRGIRNQQEAIRKQIGEDPLAIDRAARDLRASSKQVFWRGITLRDQQLRAAIDIEPQWLIDTLGRRPALEADSRQINLWESTARTLIGKRIDVGVSDHKALGLNLDHDKHLAHMIEHARGVLGLAAPLAVVGPELTIA